ncbi:sperm-associated antigen 8 isoform X1 [Python bivittatus]|uniref:Sperm-associated antigen 8 isoform X1 n=1 Tax=Python bivittatus TaxID=176946 RepID=A0A9F5N0W7_PYTBI|nr:sperm-associated antigen 8 isoform X1 [Python bivittatus]
MMEHLLYQKHSKSLIEDEVYPPLEPMESLSTTRRDYKQEGFLSVPPPPTQVRAPSCQSSSQAPLPPSPGPTQKAPGGHVTFSSPQPHDYWLEQPQTFWLEHAQQVPGTSSIRTGDTPFKKCATFTTPVPEHLGQPLPYDSENCPKL